MLIPKSRLIIWQIAIKIMQDPPEKRSQFLGQIEIASIIVTIFQNNVVPDPFVSLSSLPSFLHFAALH